MLAIPADKKILLDLFGKDRPSSHTAKLAEVTQDFLAAHEKDELLLLWAKEPMLPSDRRSSDGVLPDAIAVHAKHMREFLAWASTIIGGYRPFTAFFKVITREQTALALVPREPSLGGFLNGFVGLIVGEMLSQGTGVKSFASLSLLTCQSTYSYSFARSLALGYGIFDNNIDPVSAEWSLARSLTKQPIRKLSDETLRTALHVLGGLARGSGLLDKGDAPSLIREMCRELYSQGEITNTWRLTMEQIPSSAILWNEMKGPREQRVRAFERALKELNQMDALTASFVAGVLANQIAPGTFEHLELLTPYLRLYPMAVVWYGLCAGLHPDSEVLHVGNCLGRRLARDLLAGDPIVSRPKYDISVRELEVYLDRQEPVEFRAASQSHIAVELLPGVAAYMKWPLADVPSADSGYPRDSQLAPRQVDLYSNSTAKNTSRSRASWLEPQSVVRDLELVVDRLKIAIDHTIQGATDDTPHDRSGNKRRKGR